MKLTNIYGLPQPLYSAVKNDSYRKAGIISVTGLIRPPIMRVLEQRHDEELTQDCSERIWSLLGQSVHAVLERADTENHLVEERLSGVALGWKVTGQADLLDADGVLTDWKVTSVYSFLLGDKPEWVAQLNAYAWLYRQAGFGIKKIQIVAILRDWTQSKAISPDYPKAPAMTVDIPLWNQEKTQTWIEERVRLHQEAEALPDEKLPICTPSERWERPTTYAAKKPANKRATRVFGTLAEAEGFAKENGLITETRPGQNIRCSRFCMVSKFCTFGKTQQPGEDE